MIKYFIAALSLAFLCASEAKAATWYGLYKTYTDNALYYFDFDTVTKQAGTVTIWIKYVNDQDSPDSDGSYSTAQKTVYGCAKRTLQILTMSTYGKTGEFIQTYFKPGKVTDIVPGSVAEGILKTVCAPDFPNSKSDLYFAVKGNDIYKNTASYFDYVRAAKNDPAPK